jgi:hypothetical protein
MPWCGRGHWVPEAFKALQCPYCLRETEEAERERRHLRILLWIWSIAVAVLAGLAIWATFRR